MVFIFLKFTYNFSPFGKYILLFTVHSIVVTNSYLSYQVAKKKKYNNKNNTNQIESQFFVLIVIVIFSDVMNRF